MLPIRRIDEIDCGSALRLSDPHCQLHGGANFGVRRPESGLGVQRLWSAVCYHVAPQPVRA